MLSSNLIPSFYYNNFIAAISEPFTSLNAYRAGVIDANGNILKPESSIDPFEYLVIKLKKIFAELPPGLTKAKLSSYVPALQLFGEEVESFGLNKDHVDMIIEGFITAESNGNVSYIELKEDMTSGNLGGPASSPTQNTGSVTGFDLPIGGILKRKPKESVLGFEKQACEMYDVCPEDFDLYSNPNLKSWDELEETPTKRLMQRSQRRNGGSTIIIRDIGTNRYHKLNLMPRNISKMFEDVDLSIFKTVFSEEQAASVAYKNDSSQTDINEESLQESLNDAAKEFVNKVAGPVIVKPPEIDIVPETGNLKRGSRAQRVGYLFSGISDLLAGADPQTTLDTLSPYAQSEVSASGIDTMCFDDKKGLFVPCDIKTHTTTPFGHIGDLDIEKIKGLAKLNDTVKQAIKDGNITVVEKEKIRDAAKVVSSSGRNPRALSDILLGKLTSPFQYQSGNRTRSAPTNWFILPGLSRRQYNFGGLVQIPSSNIANYARNASQARLDPRFSEGGVEWKSRGRDISSQEISAQLQGPGSRITNPEQVARFIERHVSRGRNLRNLNSILTNYYRMMRG